MVLVPDFEATRDVNVNYHISLLQQILDTLPTNVREQIKQSDFKSLFSDPELHVFQEGINQFVKRFGHLSESANDLSRVTWQENPDLVFNLIINYQPRMAGHQRQTKEEIKRSQLNFWQKMTLRCLYAQAMRYLNYREKITYLYNYGYGKLRPCFQHLAEIFKNNGYISTSEDIFYLTFEEIERIIAPDNISEEYITVCKQRQEEMMRYTDIKLPETIIGESLPPPIVGHKSSTTLKGIPASGGYTQGRICMIRTINDFIKMDSGEVMVIPYSDVSWTPLFSKARAIISESGGFLSHCSIVAREFGIPAIVAVEGAMQLTDGMMVKVNGFTGEIVLSDEEG
jgi:pyruvate,water dikinase